MLRKLSLWGLQCGLQQQPFCTWGGYEKESLGGGQGWPPKLDAGSMAEVEGQEVESC